MGQKDKIKMFKSEELDVISDEIMDVQNTAFHHMNLEEDDFVPLDEDPDMKIILDDNYEED